MNIDKPLTELADRIATLSSRPLTFLFAGVYVAGWAAAGPLFHFSDSWQLVMDTGSSIVTFLMVFLIQNTQARDSEAIQAKLDELIRAVDEADNRFIQLERFSNEAIQAFRDEHGPRPEPLRDNDEP